MAPGLASNPEDDATIVALIQAQSPDGLRLLLRAHGGRINSVLEKKFGSSVAVDAASIAAFTVWRRIDRYSPEMGSLAAWFTSIASNAARSLLRADKAWRRFAGSLDPDVYAPSARPHDSDEWGDAKAQLPANLLIDLRKVIAGLPDLQRRVIEVELEGHQCPSASELGRRFGTTANSIYVSRNKARTRIREELRRLGWPFPARRSA